MAEGSMGYTIFLLKKDQRKAFEKDFPPTAATALKLSDTLVGRFHPLPATALPVKWLDAVRPLLKDPTALDLRSQSPAGVLVIERKDRTFLMTFGHAWLKLEDKWLESDFGRRVALNTIKQDGLLEIRAEQVFAKWHVSSDRSPRASKVDEFGVEFDRDLVAVVEGESSVKTLGKTVRGGTSLRLNIPVAQLVGVLDEAEKHFLSDRYKKFWPDIDNLNPVKDPALIAAIEKQMDDEFASGAAQKRLVLFTPTYRRDEPFKAESYVYGRMSKTPATAPYLTVVGWLNHLDKIGASPSIGAARQTAIHMLDDVGAEPKRGTAFDCFGYELALGSRQFILSSGIWYEAEPKFLERVNRSIRNIEDGDLDLPKWDQIESEAEYNRRCATRESGLLFFDAKNIHYGGGQSQFEFCDLLHPKSKTMVFAKIPSKSSGMSHLVEQVRRTSELVFSPDPGFRREVKKLFQRLHKDASRDWLDSRPVPLEWHMCLVSLGRKKSELPLFAKCSLMQLHKDMEAKGHRMSFINV